jgi:outer membrane protein
MSNSTGNKVLLGVLILGIVGSLSFSFWDHSHRPKTGFIIIGEVYSQFDLKKENEKKFTEVKNYRKKILDSMAFTLRILAKKIDGEKAKNKEDISSYNLKREEFFQRQKNFDEDNKQLTAKYDQEILTQINQYVRDYAGENGYQYIFGNGGDGSLMFGDDGHNVTKQVIEYVNKKYKGSK